MSPVTERQKDSSQDAPSGDREGLRVGVETLDDLAGAGREEWDALFRGQVGITNPFCAPEWVEGWYRRFTAPDDRHLVVVRQGSGLVGVAPFFRSRVTVGGLRLANRMQLVGAGQGGSLLELPQVLAAPELKRAVLRAVVAHSLDRSVAGNADWAEVAIPVADGWFEPEWSYSSGQPVAFFRPQTPRASVVLELAGDWETTRTGLKRNLKESLRRSRNRLAKDGRPWAVVWRTTELDEQAVDGFLDLHRERADQDAGVVHADAFADPLRAAFLRELLPVLGRSGRATLVELHLDGQMVAVQLALHSPGTTYLHSSGFVPEVWSLGPVTFLQGLLAAQAADRGERWLNFSPGPNVAKLRWSETLDVHQDFAYGSGSKGLRWRYGIFAMGQAHSQVGHAVGVSARHSAPARVDSGLRAVREPR